MKVKLFIMFGLCASLFAACTTIDANDADANDDIDALAETWGDDLTLEQVVQTMPITVNTVLPNATTELKTNGIVKMNAVAGTAKDDAQAVKVEWTIPVKSCWGFCENPGIWEISEQDENGDWQIAEAVAPTWEYNIFAQSTITYSVELSWKSWWSVQALTYFKVAMTDHNGDKYENVVTFMVCPKDNPIEITLVDASADASSKLYVEYGYDQAEEELFVTNDSSLNELVLPQNVALTSEVLPALEPIKFTIRTDFTGFNFDENIAIHQSNSSFCKVTKITTGLPANVKWRFKFAFEDLPLDKKAIEGNGLFDYNDLVFLVDIMKL